MTKDEEYLGDGVYASHDGYQIWLAANHHENKVIALEPAVLARLMDYVKSLKQKKEKTTVRYTRAELNEFEQMKEGTWEADRNG